MIICICICVYICIYIYYTHVYVNYIHIRNSLLDSCPLFILFYCSRGPTVYRSMLYVYIYIYPIYKKLFVYCSRGPNM